MNILTINSGSSSLKFAIFNTKLECITKGRFERINLPNSKIQISDENEYNYTFPETMSHKDCLIYLVDYLNKNEIEINGVGHRVVHGGDYFSTPTIIDEESLKIIKSLTPLAPLHQPHNISGIEAVQESLGNIKQVAVFDTAFHQSIPKINKILPIPRKFYDENLKAYGFHGLSYDYISRQDEAKKYSKIVIAHLGNGSSACALLKGKSFATTMGFTTIDGLMMGTRTGSLDPGVILHLINSGKSTEEITSLLYKESGLLGVSGISSDIRDLINSKEEPAVEAVKMYTNRISEQIAKLATQMNGLEAIIFTAGIGENSHIIRKMVCDNLLWIGVDLDENKNNSNLRKINWEGSRVQVFTIPTNEEWIIAEAVKNNTTPT